MRRGMIALGVTAGLAAAGGTLHAATQWLDWADEFISATILCVDVIDGQECVYDHYWDGDWQSDEPRKWDYLGSQHATAAGRANAVEEVYTSWHDAGSGCFGMTVNLARRRTTSIPSPGFPCTDGSQTYVGSVSYTKNSCVFEDADWDLSHRNLPRYDFSQETAPAVTDVGYRSTLSISCTNPGCPSRTLTGCFKIKWF